MKAVVNKGMFLDGLTKAAVVASSKSPKEAYRYVRFSSEDGRLQSTNGEMSIDVSLRGVDCLSPGVVLLPFDRILSLFKQVSEDRVSIESSGTVVDVITRTGRFTFQTPSGDIFPLIAVSETENGILIHSDSLRSMIKRVSYASHPSGGHERYSLEGVCFSYQNGRLYAAAMDGRRASLQAYAATCLCGTWPANVVVPNKSIATIDRLLSCIDEDVKFYVDKSSVSILTTSFAVSALQVSGRFPDVGKIMKATGNIVSINVGRLLNAIGQVSVAVEDGESSMYFEFNGHELTLNAARSSVGQSRLSLATEGSAQSILMFNYRFIVDILKAHKPEVNVFMHVSSDKNKPMMMTTDDGFTSMVMPQVKE